MHGEAYGPAAGLALLEAIKPEWVAAHQPYWGVRAHLLQAAGRGADAATAYRWAIGLTEDQAVRRYLSAKAGTPEHASL